MNDLVRQCHNWLRSRYKDRIDVVLGENGVVVWRNARRDDLRAECSPAQATAGLLLDDVIGLALIIIPLDLTSEYGKLQVGIESDLHQALRFRSQLLPQDTGNPESDPKRHDPKGTWRVCLHWLVPSGAFRDWKMAVMELRRKTGAFDEIPVDAVEYQEKDSLAAALDSHGLPRLLIECRRLFKQSVDAVDRWASADEKIREALSDFPKQFSAPRDRSIAEQVERLANSFRTVEPTLYPRFPGLLRSVAVENFRAIHHLRMEGFLGRKAQHTRAWIVHGPNGSGKTSFAEAIALRSFGSFGRYVDFLEDRDVSKGKNSAGYIGSYLTNLTPPGAGPAQPPRCRINNDEDDLLSNRLKNSLVEATEASVNMEGTLVAQEDTRDFVDLKGEDRAVRLARSFSVLANRVEDLVARGYDAARTRRAEFISKFGLTANAKLRETIRNSIVASKIGESLTLPASNREFLSLRSRTGGNDGRLAAELSKVLDAEFSATSREAVGRKLGRLAESDSTESNLALALLPFFTRWRKILMDYEDIANRFNLASEPVRNEIDDIIEQANLWSQWLLRSSPSEIDRPAGEQAKIEALNLKLSDLFSQRAKVEEQERLLRPRFDHLSQAVAFIRQHWAEHNPKTCPTCNSKLPEATLEIVAALRDDMDRQITAHRSRYEAVTQEIRDIENQLKAVGQNQCPVPAPTRDRIQYVMSKLIGDRVSAEASLSSKDTQADSLRLLHFVRVPPPKLVGLLEPAEDAKLAAQKILQDWRTAAEVAEEPDAWEAVKKALNKRIGEVVTSHLPATIERVWRELVFALTPARWLLPEIPTFHVESRKDSRRVDIWTGEGRLARYLLNNAEQHVLGLAWLFTRHFQEGRFRNAWLLLDDPAQEMDQPTYRDLCRLLATILRLYEYEKQDFTLVLLLGQEERALEAAREADSGLYVLGWERDQDEMAEVPTMRRILLTGPGYHSMRVNTLFAPPLTTA